MVFLNMWNLPSNLLCPYIWSYFIKYYTLELSQEFDLKYYFTNFVLNNVDSFNPVSYLGIIRGKIMYCNTEWTTFKICRLIWNYPKKHKLTSGKAIQIWITFLFTCSVGKSQVTGNVLRVFFFNMYDTIKSCVKNGIAVFVFILSDLGVHQGESLSLFLFSIFLSNPELFNVKTT